MNIYTVCDNLKRTISNKEEMLQAIQRERTMVGLRDGEDIALSTTAQFLKINIDELKRILYDVEECCEKTTHDSWKENPDRMGGQYTQEEIDRSDRWV